LLDKLKVYNKRALVRLKVSSGLFTKSLLVLN
jgi:hypothetical protein